jgi:hypothetical protein
MLTSKIDTNTGLTSLPFVKDDPSFARPGERGPLCFWAVETTGDASHDWALGAEYARAALDYIRATGTTPLLTYIVDSIVSKGEALDAADGSGRVIVGFMEEIARHAMFGWHVLDALDRAEAGWTAIVRREQPKDEGGKGRVLVGSMLGIPRPEPMPCPEIRRPIKKAAAS